MRRNSAGAIVGRTSSATELARVRSENLRVAREVRKKQYLRRRDLELQGVVDRIDTAGSSRGSASGASEAELARTNGSTSLPCPSCTMAVVSWAPYYLCTDCKAPMHPTCASQWADENGPTNDYLCTPCWSGRYSVSEQHRLEVARRRQRLVNGVLGSAETVGNSIGGSISTAAAAAVGVARGVVQGVRTVGEIAARRQEVRFEDGTQEGDVFEDAEGTWGGEAREEQQEATEVTQQEHQGEAQSDPWWGNRDPWSGPAGTTGPAPYSMPTATTQPTAMGGGLGSVGGSGSGPSSGVAAGAQTSCGGIFPPGLSASLGSSHPGSAFVFGNAGGVGATGGGAGGSGGGGPPGPPGGSNGGCGGGGAGRRGFGGNGGGGWFPGWGSGTFGGAGGAPPPPPPPPGGGGGSSHAPSENGDPMMMSAVLEFLKSRMDAQDAEMRRIREDAEKAAKRPNVSRNVRVKAEVEWPTFDGTDAYYDIEDFFKDMMRVMGIASGGAGYPPQERLEMLRGSLRAVPLLDFKTYVDDDEQRNAVVISGARDQQEELWEQVKSYLTREHHKPLMERQKRARAEFAACTMRDGGYDDYLTFQTEFKKCVKNLERAKLQKPSEELKFDFLERLPLECSQYLLLNPYRDEHTREVRTLVTAEEAMSMARTYFTVHESTKVVYNQEEILALRSQDRAGGKGHNGGKGGGRGGGQGVKSAEPPSSCKTCRTCGGYGHFATACPSKAAKGAKPTDVCSCCAGTGHWPRDHSAATVGELEQQAPAESKGGGKGGGGAKGLCFSFRDRGSCKFGDSCRFAHDVAQKSGGGAQAAKQFKCDDCDKSFELELALSQHKATKHNRAGGQSSVQGGGAGEVSQRPVGGQVLSLEELDGDEEPLTVGATELGNGEAEELVAPLREAKFKKFTDVTNITVRRRGPAGRSHKMFVWFGDLKVKVVKDTGASATTIPESCVVKVLNRYVGEDPSSTTYPIGELFKYDTPIRLVGFAASKPVTVTHGCILYVTLKDVVNKAVTTVPVEFRVIPDEFDTGGMPLLGAKTVGPEGLDIRTTAQHHVVAKFGIRCARAEQDRAVNNSVEECMGSLTLGSEDLYLEPGELKQVWVQAFTQSVGLERAATAWLEPLDDEDVGVSLLAGPAVVDDFVGDEGVAVWLAAPESTPVYLEAGETVGRFALPDAGRLEMVRALDVEEVNEVIFDDQEPVDGHCLTPEEIQELSGFLRQAVPEASPDVLKHVAHLGALYTTAASVGLSFKHAKSQLLEVQIKLLGNLVSRTGLAPDPEKIQGLVDMPPPRNKTQLREFFGTLNWIRPFLGTKFAATSEGLRRYLKNKFDDDFGELDAEARESFEALKKLAEDHVMLQCPDYDAALQGSYFEIILDASVIGGGAILCQPDPVAGKPRTIATMSRGFTAAQQAWEAWVRELWMMKEACIEFAPFVAGYECRAWTDHKNNVSISQIPPGLCGEKIIRWWGRILTSGVKPAFLAGKVNPSDGLSRNPKHRDKILEDRERLKNDPVAMEAAFKRSEFDDEADEVDWIANVREGLLHEALVSARKARWVDPLEREPDVVLAGDELAQVVRVLAVPTWEAVESSKFAMEIEQVVAMAEPDGEIAMEFNVVVADPPMLDDEGLAMWYRFPRGGREELQRKELRKSLFTGVVEFARQLRRWPVDVVVAHGQGAVVVALALDSAVLQVALVSRFVLADERKTMLEALARIRQVFYVRPAAHPRHGKLELIIGAVPEWASKVDYWSQLEVPVGCSPRSDAALFRERVEGARCVENARTKRSFMPMLVKPLVARPVALEAAVPSSPCCVVVNLDDSSWSDELWGVASGFRQVGGRRAREVFAGSAVLTAMWRSGGVAAGDPYDVKFNPQQDYLRDEGIDETICDPKQTALAWLAPPCRLLSAARKSVPPLRTNAHPEAYPGDEEGRLTDELFEKVFRACERMDDNGVLFVMEQPAYCFSLWLPGALRLLARETVFIVRICYCQLGRRYRKSTVLITNWRALMELNRACNCPGQHEEVLSGDAAAKAAEYPVLLCAGVTRLMLRDGVGCQKGTIPPRSVPSVPWLEASLEEVRAVAIPEPVEWKSGALPMCGAEDSPPVEEVALGPPIRAGLLEAQRKDVWCGRMLKYLEWQAAGGTLAEHGLLASDANQIKREAEEYEIAPDGVLHRRVYFDQGPPSVPVFPEKSKVIDEMQDETKHLTWRRWALLQAHDVLAAGHMKAEKALPLMRRRCWWDSMAVDLNEWCRDCEVCQHGRSTVKQSMTITKHPRGPFECVQIDLQGSISPPSTEGWRYVLTVICTFSRYVFLRGVRSKNRYEVAQTLLGILWEIGSFPTVWQSDRGLEFVNEVLQALAEVLRAKQRVSPAYSPRIQGIAERSHRTMAHIMRLIVSRFAAGMLARWGEFLLCVQYHMRQSPIGKSGVTPQQLIHTWLAANPADRAVCPWVLEPAAGFEDEWLRSTIKRCQEITEQFKCHLDDYEVSIAARRDKGAVWILFRAGDRVMLERPPVGPATSTFFLEGMDGPFVIKRMIGTHRAVLTDPATNETYPAGAAGEAGVATSRLIKLPAQPSSTFELEDGPPPRGAGGIAEDHRRKLVKLNEGRFVGYRLGEDRLGVGQVRANFPRRSLLLVAVHSLQGGARWVRMYMDAEGAATTTPTSKEMTVDVPYVDIVGEVKMDTKGELKATSKRLVDAHALIPVSWPVAEPAHPPIPEVQAVAEPVEAILAYPPIPAVFVGDGSSDALEAKDLDAEEAEKVANDEVLFPDRSTRRYAAYVAAVTWKMVRANPNLSEPDRLLIVGTCVKFRGAIWLDGSDYTRVKGAVYDVDVGEADPIAQQPYRKSPIEQEQSEWHVQKAITLGILSRHVGGWATPAFVVKQKGKPRGRLVCDYRRVNAVTRRMFFPMPRVDETLRRCAGAKWFSALDAVSGFNHLRLTPRAKDRLAIVTSSGLYCWESLPFGPVDGPQAFQCFMRKAFNTYMNQWLEIYIDDLALHTGA